MTLITKQEIIRKCCCLLCIPTSLEKKRKLTRPDIMQEYMTEKHKKKIIGTSPFQWHSTLRWWPFFVLHLIYLYRFHDNFGHLYISRTFGSVISCWPFWAFGVLWFHRLNCIVPKGREQNKVKNTRVLSNVSSLMVIKTLAERQKCGLLGLQFNPSYTWVRALKDKMSSLPQRNFAIKHWNVNQHPR